MLFCWDITIPKGTTEDDPLEQTLKVSKGVVVKVQFKYPSGCHGLVKVRILRLQSQIWPLSPGEWITGDDEIIDAPEYYEFLKGPYTLKLIGCAPSTTYDHTITVRLVILPKPVASMAPFLDLLQKLFSRISGPTEETE